MTQQPSGDEGGRELSYSGPHESKDLVKLLVNATFCLIAKIVTRPAVPSLIHDSVVEYTPDRAVEATIYLYDLS